LNGSYAERERLVNNINVTFPTNNKKNGRNDFDFDHEFFLLELDVRVLLVQPKVLVCVMTMSRMSYARFALQEVKKRRREYTMKKVPLPQPPPSYPFFSRPVHHHERSRLYFEND